MSKDAKRSPLWPALALIVVALSIAGWYVEEHQHARATSAEAVREATEWVRAGFEAGDAVRVEPAWDDGPWSALQGMGKGTGRFPFPALLRGDTVDPLHAPHHQRRQAYSQ